MNTTILAGSQVYEYALVVQPHEDLQNRIVQLRKQFNETYKIATPAGTRTHVLLVNFKQYESMQEKILRRLHWIAMGYHPFKIELQDFGNFPSHTIYINVATKIPV